MKFEEAATVISLVSSTCYKMNGLLLDWSA